MRTRWILAALMLSGAASPVFATEPNAPPSASPLQVFTIAPGSLVGDNADLATASENCREKCWQFSVGARTWVSWGESTWTFGGPGGNPNVAVDLRWRNLQSTVGELTFEAVRRNRFLVSVDVGAGAINNGRLEEAHYAGQDRTGLNSLTRSDVENEYLLYANVDLGYRLICRGPLNCYGDPKLTVDALVGYQYWREKYVSTNANQIVPPTGVANPGAFVGDESWVRHNIRVGFRGAYQFGDRLGISSRVVCVPWASQSMLDHIGTASFDNDGDGGWGLMGDATVSYRFTRRLSAEVGYRIWYQEGDGGNGVVVNRVTTRQPTGDLTTLRHGILVGLKWQF